MSLSTHVLDAVSGTPADGLAVTVESLVDGAWQPAAAAHTDSDGRVRDLGVSAAGVHRIRFDTAEFFARSGVPTFYPEVTVTFEIVDSGAHHHVPLLLSPYAYSTYRGS
jgi:5-hydroxyisourate hydrolase